MVPLVSVITATYNIKSSNRADKFLQCIESVHRQTYPNIEHIIIDGASNDGTVDILKEYAQQGYFRYISEPDTGIYDAMNKGLRHARGKYIAFLNSDDYWSSSAGVESSVRLLEAAKADFSYAPCSFVEEDDTPAFLMLPNIGAFFYRLPFCHQTMFTRRDLMLELGGFDQINFRSAADYDFIIRLIMRGAKPVHVPENFTVFRLGGFSENWKLSVKEMQKSHDANFGRMLKKEDIKKLHSYRSAPAAFIETLGSFVHPTVYTSIRHSVEKEEGVLCAMKEMSRIYEIKYSKQSPDAEEKIDTPGIRRKLSTIFGLPLCTVDHYPKKGLVLYKVFNISFSIKEIDRETPGIATEKMKLFGLFPLWKRIIFTKGDSEKIYLFSIIKIASYKTKIII